MNYSKTYLSIVFASFLLALWMISSVKSLETTWLGVYNREGDIQRETKNEYSKIFFTKRECGAWVKKHKKIKPQGVYFCGKNCTLEELNLLNCQQLYKY